jgi:hypothetical protein
MARRKLDIDSLPSNNLEPVEEKDITPIIMTGGVRTQSSGGFSATIRNIANALFDSIVIPAMQSLTEDFVGEAVRMLVRGGKDASKGATRGRHTAYHSQYSRRRRRRGGPTGRNVKRTREVYEDIYFDYREDAEAVLGRMMELIAEYRWATIGDLHALAEMDSNYTHERYGWTDLRRTRVQHTTDGYLITFPEPEYIK